MVKRTAIEKRLRLFFTMFSTSASEVESVQPSSVVVEEVVQNKQVSTRAMEVAQTKPQSEVQASSSAVNVIPLDCHNPEATINTPQAVKRYLIRWPRGDMEKPHPIFENTDLHDFRTMHNNQDDDKRRAALAQVVPSHVKVSLLHPWLKMISFDL